MLTPRLQTVLALTALAIALTSIISDAIAQQPTEAPKRRAIRRVKRPVFEALPQDDPFFQNLFADGVLGDRPDVADLQAVEQKPAVGMPLAASGSTKTGKAVAWAALISGETIENEIKRLQREMLPALTNPVKFKTQHTDVRQAFSMLSTLFAIVSQYPGDVRWKADARAAQAACAEATVAARDAGLPAFNACKRRSDEVNDLIRGSRFSGNSASDQPLAWDSAADRDALMERLELSLSSLKAASANKKQFKRGRADVIHQAELIAGLAIVLVQESLPEADEAGYCQLSQEMAAAATSCKTACQQDDFDGASRAINLIEQSCSNCHEEWR